MNLQAVDLSRSLVHSNLTANDKLCLRLSSTWVIRRQTLLRNIQPRSLSVQYLQLLPITSALPPELHLLSVQLVALDSHGSGNTDEASLLSCLLFTSYCIGTGHRPNRPQACPVPGGLGTLHKRKNPQGRLLTRMSDETFQEDMKAKILLGIFRRGGREGSFPGRKNHCQSEEEERLQLLPETERNSIWLELSVFGVDKQQQWQMMKAWDQQGLNRKAHLNQAQDLSNKKLLQNMAQAGTETISC